MNKKTMNIVVASLFAAAVLSGCGGKPEAGNAPAPKDLASAQPAAVPAGDAYVQRGYPTADEERALGLNYPLYKDYGSDMARLTPFFPGTGDRPLSVKLKANDAGYGLKAEGDGCQFAVIYELKQADGKVAAQGEYKAPEASTIPGWQGDSRDFSVRMADGAKDNYSCNIVVSKL